MIDLIGIEVQVGENLPFREVYLPIGMAGTNLQVCGVLGDRLRKMLQRYFGLYK